MGQTGTPQAVLAPLTEAAVFFVATIGPGNDAEQATLDLLGDVASLTRSVGFRIPEAELTCVTGIGADALGPAVRCAAPRRAAPLP